MSAPSFPTDPEAMNIKTCPVATNAVKVENISARAISEVAALFKTLIGGVKSSRVCENALGCYLEITFFNHDAASKALCMSGYSVHGTNLYVIAFFVLYMRALETGGKPFEQGLVLRVLSDGSWDSIVLLAPPRRLISTFDRNDRRTTVGIFVHCVILATVDNSSRRRGFVVMSSHDEAKHAMTSLTRSQIKGHCLDISWAVVQRSQGFLDGGDRAHPLDSRGSYSTFARPETYEDSSANSSTTSISTGRNDLASLTPSLAPTPTLLVINLPTLLFSQTQDMHPLFYPFGRIKRLNLVETHSDGSTSAIVEYESAAIAQEAKEALSGQYYIGHQIAVHYVRSKSALLDLASVPDVPAHNKNASHTFDPFALQSLLGPVGSHYGSTHNSQRFHNNAQYIFRATHPFSSNFRQRNTSRSSSASSRWSIDPVQDPCSWLRYSPTNCGTANIPHHGLLV